MQQTRFVPGWLDGLPDTGPEFKAMSAKRGVSGTTDSDTERHLCGNVCAQLVTCPPCVSPYEHQTPNLDLSGFLFSLHSKVSASIYASLEWKPEQSNSYRLLWSSITGYVFNTLKEFFKKKSKKTLSVGFNVTTLTSDIWLYKLCA